MSMPLIGLFDSSLSVSLGTANLLAYFMLCMVAVFLISGPIIVYAYYKKSKRERATTAVPNPT